MKGICNLFLFNLYLLWPGIPYMRIVEIILSYNQLHIKYLEASACDQQQKTGPYVKGIENKSKIPCLLYIKNSV